GFGSIILIFAVSGPASVAMIVLFTQLFKSEEARFSKKSIIVTKSMLLLIGVALTGLASFQNLHRWASISQSLKLLPWIVVASVLLGCFLIFPEIRRQLTAMQYTAIIIVVGALLSQYAFGWGKLQWGEYVGKEHELHLLIAPDAVDGAKQLG